MLKAVFWMAKNLAETRVDGSRRESKSNRKRQQGLAMAGCLLFAGSSILAADPMRSDPPDGPLFHANELTLDAFGTVSAGKSTLDAFSVSHVKRDGRLGAGLGANYFFTRNFGIGGEAYTENTKHSFVDNANGHLMLRIPIDAIHLAPYGFGGGGYQFDPVAQWTLHAGAGLEVRIVRQFGLFADARFVWADKTANYGLARAGVRLGF